MNQSGFFNSVLGTLTLTMLMSACGVHATNDTTSFESAAIATRAEGRLLSATFGVDNFGGLGACANAPSMDGLPVVFSVPLSIQSVQASDFEVLRADGSRALAQCASFFPAVNADERRTVLLQGDFGSESGGDPKQVTIVGSIRSEDGRVNFKGQSVAVVPYAIGQHLVYARRQVASENTGGQDQCPKSVSGKTVTQVIQLAFGSNAGNSFSSTPEYLSRFTVYSVNGAAAHPVAFGDTTVDNYLELCLTAKDSAERVEIVPNTVTDASGQYNEVTISAPLEN